MPLVLTPRSVSGGSGALPPPLRLDAGSAVIGRTSGADLLLSHPLVSSRHCAVTGQGASWQVQDMSTNGTLVNGRRVAGAHPLRDGDVIGIADVELAVSIAEGTAGQWSPAARPSLDDWGRPAPAAAPAPQAAWAASGAPAVTGDPVGQLLQAAGLSRGAVQGGDAQVIAAVAAVLKASITGLAGLAQARRDARQELRLPANPAGDNPLTGGKPDAALSRLLAMQPAAAGEAVAAACKELDAHQRAGLAAMQAAFKAALDQFAPAAIKLRARDDAAAWKAYEKAFEAKDGFVDVFAQEFAKAYQRLTGG